MMRKLITLRRIIVAGARNIFRNAWLTTAATAVMMITLTIMLGGWMLQKSLTAMIDDVKQKVDITIELSDSITEEQRRGLEAELRSHPNATQVRFVSKDDALALYREQQKDNPLLLEGVSEENNFLPASFGVSVRDLNEVESVISIADSDAYKDVAEPIREEKRLKIIQRIGAANDFIIRAAMFGTLVFGLISGLIIFNTIRMAIFSRGEELRIMRLIGAGTSFIRGPFLVESMLYGAIAAIVSLIVAYSTLLSLAPNISAFVDFGVSVRYFTEHLLFVGSVVILTGMFLGFISSFLATKRYLKF